MTNRVLTTKLKDLGSISGTETVEGENQHLQAVLWHPHIQCGTATLPMHMQKK